MNDQLPSKCFHCGNPLGAPADTVNGFQWVTDGTPVHQGSGVERIEGGNAQVHAGCLEAAEESGRFGRSS